ncbi:MAG: hypothetical protein BGO47_12800 [Microbacterium sp. 67-17]|uniref:hypothetical protein n=1 Tax=Microbacterium sp. 67-17 TaxID=1895782 RepID=UPI00095AB842|nr:hypothetical protein [Microbacterium sp. 67-17]OJW01349.1 MAG: hypothetical protein BGO47_12800 [Microbacterium sp. 67-17]
MAMSALAVADTKKASPQRRASWVAFALLLPGLAYLALFFLVPFVSLLITSFGVNDTSQYGAFYYAFNWACQVFCVSGLVLVVRGRG